MRLLYIILLLCSVGVVELKPRERMRIMTYNVENLFDTKNDTTINDNDFLPEGDRHWTYTRYRNKINNISRVIASIGEWNPPMIVGLCEVENDYVLKTLVQYGPLKEIGYKYLHYESPDSRGIDVALLYRPDMFTPLISEPIEVNIGEHRSTRDILYTCGTISTGEQIHFLQVHLPSRRGGEHETEGRRIAVAKVLREKVDSLFALDSKAAIVIMGDFNDYPDDRSVAEVLYARKYVAGDALESTGLYNLAWAPHDKGEGTYCIKGSWGMLDQIIVSGSLLGHGMSFEVDMRHGARVYSAEWMMKYDERVLDSIPRRTYNGWKYEGGYSDHLPLYIDFVQKGY